MGVNHVTTVDGEELINLMSDTVSETNLLEGETAHAANGEAIVGKAKYINPNLLINPDFSINQRGQTEYTSTGYTVDSWVLGIVGSGNTGSYSPDTKTLMSNTVETNGYYTYLGQPIEKPSRLAGKVVTFSVAFKSTDNLCMIQVWKKSNGVTTSVAATSYNTELYKILSFTVPEDITDNDTLQFIIQTRGTSVLDWAKLEAGSVATPFVPPNPAVELVKCQRYLLELAQSSAYRAVAIGTDYIDFSIPTPTTMRPISGMSIINPENFVVRSINPTVDQTGFSFSVVTYGTNQLRLRALKTAHGLTDATLAVKSSSKVFLSAEL